MPATAWEIIFLKAAPDTGDLDGSEPPLSRSGGGEIIRTGAIYYMTTASLNLSSIARRTRFPKLARNIGTPQPW